MRMGVDYSERAADWPAFARALVSQGRTFVGRYLAHDPDHIASDTRAFTIAEAEALAGAGVDIFCWWENSPRHIGSETEQRALAGYDAGSEDAQLARDMMEYFGQPTRPVYFTVDTDTAADACRAYFNGVLSILPRSRAGVYGGYRVVHGLFQMDLVSYACQTEAWSYLNGTRQPPVWDPRAQLHQWTVPGHGTYAGSIGGIACDGLEALTDDFGQWRYGVVEAPEGDEDMNDKDREALYRSTVRTLGTHFDVAFLKAKADGATSVELAELEATRERDLAHEKEWLDPEHHIWPTLNVHV